MAFNPYLFFSGNCAEAFRCYHEVFGGELEMMTHADLPPGAEPMPGAEPHTVMHACITLDGGMLMGSDDPTGDDGPKTGVGVTYTASDADTARRAFDAIKVGGNVLMEFEPTFWSNGFGSCVDRFGVSWMIDTAGAVLG